MFDERDEADGIDAFYPRSCDAARSHAHLACGSQGLSGSRRPSANTMSLKTIDVPQADSLATVRVVVSAVSSASDSSAAALSRATGFHERHVRYRLATAKALGWLTSTDGELSVTAAGNRLLDTVEGSIEERAAMRSAVAGCRAVHQMAPGLLESATFDLDVVTKRIMRLAGLSHSTAERRAVVLRAWRRDLMDKVDGSPKKS